ncbi:MAG: SAM-dependent methyltransferase, partial [Candidatus Geothermincolia bacterium]
MKPVVHCVGLGPGSRELMTVAADELLRGSREVLVRTLEHPAAAELAGAGVVFRSFDSLYLEGEEMDEVYGRIALAVAEEALSSGEVVYAVPGHPLVAERTVKLLLADERVRVVLHPAVSFLDVVLPLVGLDPIDGFQLLDAGDLGEGG